MAADELYRLRLRSPLHAGRRGFGMEEAAETVRSDTLFSALCWGILQVSGSGVLHEWLDAFLQGPPPLLVSSTFPWAGDVRFLPRPRRAASTDAGDEREERAMAGITKRLKTVAYVSEVIFDQLAAGAFPGGELEDGNFLPGGLWVSGAERAKLPIGQGGLWEQPEPVAHVSVDRVSSAGALYHVGEVRYREGCGLWFAVRWMDTGWRSVVESALSALGESGIGGERSSGRGQFRWDSRPWDSGLARAGRHGAGVLLSLYHPTRQDVEMGALDEAMYRLELRRGWIAGGTGQGLRSMAVRMLAEGSVLRGAESGLGDLVDVTPRGFRAHPVYRYGLAFVVGSRPDG